MKGGAGVTVDICASFILWMYFAIHKAATRAQTPQEPGLRVLPTGKVLPTLAKACTRTNVFLRFTRKKISQVSSPENNTWQLDYEEGSSTDNRIYCTNPTSPHVPPTTKIFSNWLYKGSKGFSWNYCSLTHLNPLKPAHWLLFLSRPLVLKGFQSPKRYPLSVSLTWISDNTERTGLIWLREEGRGFAQLH